MTAVTSRSRVEMLAWIATAFVVGVVATLALVNFKDKPPAAEVVRFQIPRASAAGFGPAPQLSPDGRHVAFIALGGGDGRQLWVRSLDSIESRSLAGTEGVFNTVFWSPDSRSLGFVAQGKLKRVNASGGPPQTICDLPGAMALPGQMGTFRAGAWNRDGVIIFGTNNTGLWRVSATGGPLTEVTEVDRSRKEIFHGGPDFLPGGRHFLYERVGADQEDSGMHVGSLDAKPGQQSEKRLLTAGSSAIYTPAFGPGSSTGHLLFTREGALMAQAFDPDRLELSGEAVPIAQGMSVGGPRAFSASMTGILAYRTGGFGGEYDDTVTQLTWFDRGGKVLSTVGEPGQYNSVALSPDGTRVAVSRVSPQAIHGRKGRPEYDIWVHEFARGTDTRLTTDPASDWLATWSPDGGYIMFSSERDGSVFNLYRKASSGAGGDDLVLKSNQDKSAQDWSRDGKFLLYSVAVNGRRSFAPPASHDLWVLPLSQGDHKPQLYLSTEFNETQGRFSPDGGLIAYSSDASGRNEIYVQPFPNPSGGQWRVSTNGGIAPRWQREGKELLYISADSKMMAVEVSTRPMFKAGIPKALFQAPIWGGGTTTNITRYDVTSDGKKFLINSVAAQAEPLPLSPITVVLNWKGLLKK